MADRHTFHFNHFDKFKNWLIRNGWEMKKTSEYEILKAVKNKQWVIAYKKLDAKEHFTLTNNSESIFRQYLREREIRKNLCEEVRKIARSIARRTTEYDGGVFDYVIDATLFDYIIQALRDEDYDIVNAYIKEEK